MKIIYYLIKFLNLETFLGTVIAHDNLIIISICNLYIKIDRMCVLEQIYWSKSRKYSSENFDCMISYGSFNGNIVQAYGIYLEIPI